MPKRTVIVVMCLFVALAGFACGGEGANDTPAGSSTAEDEPEQAEASPTVAEEVASGDVERYCELWKELKETEGEIMGSEPSTSRRAQDKMNELFNELVEVAPEELVTVTDLNKKEVSGTVKAAAQVAAEANAHTPEEFDDARLILQAFDFENCT